MNALDRFKMEITALVQRIMRAVNYYRLVPCTVIRQAGDGTLELAPQAQDATLPPLVGVKIRHGLPGITGVAVPAGSVVRVGFDAGDPRRPFAVLWDEGQVTSITVNASTQQAARTGDSVDCGTLLWLAAGPSLTYFPPGTPPTGPGVPIPLSGRITGTSVVNL